MSLGIAGKLKADGLLKDAKPCESLKLMLACNPFDEDGKPRDAPEKTLEAREQFIVDQIVKGKENLSVVILDGAHDLSGNAPKGVRLIEVAVKGYRDVAD